MSKSRRELADEFEQDIISNFSNKFDESVSNAKASKEGIDKPKHYDIGIDTFTRMRANATFEEAMGFIRWNIDKYNTRAKGQDEEDYKKIEAYCKEAMWWFVNRLAKE